jgi:hypothetical protein
LAIAIDPSLLFSIYSLLHTYCALDTRMDNKELGPEVPQASHNEKNALDGTHSDIPPTSGGRRGSTALNIVENPLQVR